MLSEDRRREIAAFLRSRRERLQPEQLGLPRGRRRRTPGLRREEVAAAAGLSTEWYTWLEQARDVHPSAETLQQVAAALQLEPGESRHLLTLAGYGVGQMEDGQAQAASPRLQRLLDNFADCPAWIYGERWDFLAWNRSATVIHGDLAAAEGLERNGVYRLFMRVEMREMLEDWELHARDCVAKLRALHARNLGDPRFDELIEQLRAQSPEFTTWWQQHNVQLPRGGGVKRYRHPRAGLLTFEFNVLDVPGESATAAHLIAYIPAPNTGTRDKMQRLLRASAADSSNAAAVSN